METTLVASGIILLIFPLAHSWGAVSGESVEHVDLLPYTDQSVLEQCNAGQLSSARYQLDARTLSPLVG